MKNIAIIVAGGQGKRMGRPKQFLPLAGRPLLAWSLSAFQKARTIDGIIVVVAKEQLHLAKKLRFSKIIALVESGPERLDSVRNGLKALPHSTELVLIHDGARPAISVSLIERVVKETKKHGAIVVGIPVKDTIKQVKRGQVQRTIDRSQLWQAQTPQAFRLPIILAALAKHNRHAPVTDDGMLVEKMGKPVTMVLGSATNFKVTTPEELEMMSKLLGSRRK